MKSLIFDESFLSNWRAAQSQILFPEAFIQAHPELSNPSIFPDLGIPCVWLTSSGTTGFPKVIALSKAGLELSAIEVQTYFSRVLSLESSFSSGKWGLAIAPERVGGLSLILRAHLSGQSLVRWRGPWSPTKIHQWLEEQKINFISLVPTQVFDLVSKGLRAPKSLKLLFVGGDRLSESLRIKASELGWPVFVSYAMTELSSTIGIQSPSEKAFEILPHIEVRAFEDSLLGFKSNSLFLGSLESLDSEVSPPQSSVERTFRQAWLNDDGFWLSKDRGTVQGQSLNILGRSGDYVKILGVGVEISAVQVELERILPLEFLKKVHLSYRSCERKGGQLVLLCELKETQPSFKAQLEQLVQTWNVSQSKSLSLELKFVERIPRGPSGKVMDPKQ